MFKIFELLDLNSMLQNDTSHKLIVYKFKFFLLVLYCIVTQFSSKLSIPSHKCLEKFEFYFSNKFISLQDSKC